MLGYGVDNLLENRKHLIKSVPLLLITHYYMKDSTKESVVEQFAMDPEINLTRIVCPEYGFFLDSNNINEFEGIPVEKFNKVDFKRSLKKIKTVVFDLQDMGVKNSPIIDLLYDVMEILNDYEVNFFVLDRPNPINSNAFSGIIGPLNKKGLPLRHGMTIGEIALFFRQKFFISTRLNVVKMLNYDREETIFDIESVENPFLPGIRNRNSLCLYSFLHLFTAFNISIGLESDLEFCVFGAPWIDPDIIFDQIIMLGFGGFTMETCSFIPEAGIYASRECHGIKFILNDISLFDPIELFLSIAEVLHASFGELEFIVDQEGVFLLDRYFSDERIRITLERYIPLTNVYYKAMSTMDDFVLARQDVIIYS